MEKKTFGVILTVLGIIGLIGAAASFVMGKSGDTNVRLIITLLIIGGIFFFSGIGLLNNTRDRSV